MHIHDCAEQIAATVGLQGVGDVERELPFFGKSATAENVL